MGIRCTAASRQLLVLFEQAGQELLTHPQIYNRLREQRFDINRVILYRLLDRFVAAGLLERVVDQERVARYGWVACPGSSASTLNLSPRFECRSCHRQFRLMELPELCDAMQVALDAWAAKGSRGLQAEVAVRGVCERCLQH
ncbi:transcriptional repressor [Cupriavidus basilensis]|uniref:Transcriptional repressor n=1 Tax=Cupriavidus basilensis TaxID=68895 RepID=A0ABT6AL05_9BURK|nr:transcriptional repressor [Cupriavidus basilensis]MDF3833268.1 transcriptional repressor [Cupriavidus basilensis]